MNTSDLSDFGVNVDKVDSEKYQCQICSRVFDTENAIHGHINSKRLDNHPDWSELPVSRADCSAWKVKNL